MMMMNTPATRSFNAVATVGPVQTLMPISVPAGWCLTQLDDGDMLSTLVHVYDVTPEEIVKANGVPWSTPHINEWVIKTGGRWLPEVAGEPPVPGSPPGKGWAVFTSKSRIYLPCKPDAKPPAPSPTPDNGSAPACDCNNGSKSSGVGKIVGFGLLGLLAGYAVGSKPKPRRRRRRRK